ncbi:MAG: VOC family protein [Pseudomonadota bacterium]
MTQHGVFYWNELMTRDTGAAKTFYAETLGWTYDEMPMSDGSGTYVVAKTGDTMAGGFFPMNGAEYDGLPEHWMAYIAVDDIDARVAKAEANGATLMRPVFDVPGVGRIAMIKQPGGAMIGWMTPTD